MGCCSSTAGNSPIQKHSKHRRNLSQSSNPLPEEESVKEVLSETPTIPRAFRKSNELRKIPYSFPKGLALSNPDGRYQLDGFLKIPPAAAAAKNHHHHHHEVVHSEDVSESECLSSASILTEYNEENNDPEIRRRSPLKMRDRSASGDFSRGKSPRAKMNPSPNRVRSGTPNSGRRSVSPAMRNGTVQGKKGLGRSVSAGRTRNRGGMYSDRVNSETGGLRIDEDRNQSYKEDHWPPPAPPTNDDTLENPLVSLECFIFL